VLEELVEPVELEALVVPLVVPLVDDGALAVDDDAVDDEEEEDDDVDEYKSLYQPPPFRWNADADSSLPIVAVFLQAGHASGAGSLCFCSTSSRWPQAEQRYSKIGMAGPLKNRRRPSE
jgi:hypothetical protein